MENLGDNSESHELDDLNQKPIKLRRTVIGNRIYLSHSETNKCLYQERPPILDTLKSSFLLPQVTKPPEEAQLNTLKVAASHCIIDSCTQTSKTILELAKLEGRLSPDSLNQSPREPELLNKDNQVNSNLETHLTSSEYTLEGSVCEHPNSLTYVRKNNLKEYLSGCETVGNIPSEEEINLYIQKSLTETFLEKKQIDDASSGCHCRSRFLQQTSPLRNLSKEFPKYEDAFKSQSCVETYDPNFIPDDLYPEKLPLQASRFTVKNVREQQIADKAQPIKCYWPADDSQKINVESSFESSDYDSDNQSPTNYRIRQSSVNKHLNKRVGSFMSPTVASEQRNQLHLVQNLKNLISPTRRGKSLSPCRKPRPASNLVKKFNNERIPYIDQSLSHLKVTDPAVTKRTPARKSISRRNESPNMLMTPLVTIPKFDEDLLKLDLQKLDIRTSEEALEGSALPSCSTSTTSNDNVISQTMYRIRSCEWNTALRGLAEMTELCRIMDCDILFPHMIAVNQRLLELLRSPRSHVCRTACQAAGHFFESMKDTRRPEFDDIVDILLCKTADANKFIRRDANMSLDCMVTHIPIFHAVRSLCLKGPTHKNPLVRTATIRLIVCAVVIAGGDIVLNLQSHEPTRKRIILHMAKFLEDKHGDTRKYAERLYKVLCREPIFDSCLRKYMEKEDITRMKNALMKFGKEKRQ